MCLFKKLILSVDILQHLLSCYIFMYIFRRKELKILEPEGLTKGGKHGEKDKSCKERYRKRMFGK